MPDALGPWELRAKCTEAMHRDVNTFATAEGREVADVLRELVEKWIAAERHAHILRCRLLRGEGDVRDSRGIDA